MGIGSNKEGLSVFGVLNTCVTSMGRRLLRLWFTRPIIDMHALSDRQDAVQVQALKLACHCQSCTHSSNMHSHAPISLLACMPLQHILGCMLAVLPASPALQHR